GAGPRGTGRAAGCGGAPAVAGRASALPRPPPGRTGGGPGRYAAPSASPGHEKAAPSRPGGRRPEGGGGAPAGPGRRKPGPPWTANPRGSVETTWGNLQGCAGTFAVVPSKVS